MGKPLVLELKETSDYWRTSLEEMAFHNRIQSTTPRLATNWFSFFLISYLSHRGTMPACSSYRDHVELHFAAAVQCENNDHRSNLTTLNSLIVHSSPGANTALGPCGTRWASPWEGFSTKQVLRALPTLLRRELQQLNSVGADGHIPTDVVVRWGSVKVAMELVAHGAIFTARHARDASAHGHAKLAEHLQMNM